MGKAYVSQSKLEQILEGSEDRIIRDPDSVGISRIIRSEKQPFLGSNNSGFPTESGCLKLTKS